jgi:NAD(P)-dependent dehydrogenase (short-subunit alcohol dehydrogenase family)
LYDQIFSINVKSVFFFIKEAKDLLKKSSQGSNVLITSSLSGIQPGRIVGVYAMSKAAVISMA